MQIGLGLDALNFSLAGAREGFGPFLGVYLQQQGFDPATTGVAMGLAGAAGLVATTPIGALVDRTERKRLALVLAVVGIAVGALLLIAKNSLWFVVGAQLLIGVADTSIAPLIAALTLGLAGKEAYSARVARNEAFNHAGNAVNATLSAILGYTLGLSYVTIAIVVMAVAASGVLLGINPGRIDHAEARGGESDGRSTLRVLFETRPLLVLAATVFAFQTANGAMLPFLAQARTAAGSDPSVVTGVMTVTSQVTMVGAALLVPRIARGRGHGGVLAVALLVTVLRGGLAAFAGSWWTVIPVQVLEGLAMGLAGVAIPTLAADVMRGTGHAGAGLGGVMTAFGAGATLSPILAGVVAQYFGFAASFITLAGVAAVGLVFLLVAGPRSKIWVLGKPRGEASDGDAVTTAA